MNTYSSDMNSAGTILLPIAGRSSRFPGLRPKWMLAAPTGELMLEKSLRSVPNWRDHRVVVGALREHLEGQGGAIAIKKSLGDAVELVVFDQQTSGPAETVSQMIVERRIGGPIFIKDCDSWFVPQDNVFGSCVCFANLETMNEEVSNVAAKSFLHINDNGLVTGIAEKVVSSPFISSGGYGFDDSELFRSAYRRVSTAGYRGEPFVSHVVLEAMREGAVFRGNEVADYVDVGTLAAWNRFRSRHAVLIVDLDGVVFRNAGQYLPPFWDDADVPLEENVKTLKKLADKGAQITFMTARPESYRKKTEQSLRDAGLPWHAVVFGVHHSRRILINDYAASNPYPSAEAVNMPRNADQLAQYFQGLL